jgi:hypothetical protein
MVSEALGPTGPHGVERQAVTYDEFGPTYDEFGP